MMSAVSFIPWITACFVSIALHMKVKSWSGSRAKFLLPNAAILSRKSDSRKTSGSHRRGPAVRWIDQHDLYSAKGDRRTRVAT